MKKYYLAYGSNLNLRQMKFRCPNARKVGSYLLKGYELEFRYYLTIKKSKGKAVPLGIFEIDDIDERRLDRYEGYPRHYRKEQMQVTLDGQTINAIIYIMNEEIREVMPPDRYYLETCLDGYYDFGFDGGYLFNAYKRSTNKERNAK